MRLEIALLLILGVWLLALSVILVYFYLFFKKLVGKTKEFELVRILNQILKVQKENSEGVLTAEKEIRLLEEAGKGHVQKVGLVRFNPFAEIGGDHSFSLAILDGEDNGVIVTCLHTRERTRVYMKAVKKGKSNLELSAEEKKAVEKAVWKK